MKTRQITIGQDLESIIKKLESKGYKRLHFWDDLRGKGAKEKVIVKDKRWGGSWSGLIRFTHSIYYK